MTEDTKFLLRYQEDTGNDLSDPEWIGIKKVQWIRQTKWYPKKYMKFIIEEASPRACASFFDILNEILDFFLLKNIFQM